MSCRGFTLNMWIEKERMEDILREEGYTIQTFDELLIESGHSWKDFNGLDYNTRTWKFAWKGRREKEELQKGIVELIPNIESNIKNGNKGSWLFWRESVERFLINNVAHRICRQLVNNVL